MSATPRSVPESLDRRLWEYPSQLPDLPKFFERLKARIGKPCKCTIIPKNSSHYDKKDVNAILSFATVRIKIPDADVSVRVNEKGFFVNSRPVPDINELLHHLSILHEDITDIFLDFGFSHITEEFAELEDSPDLSEEFNISDGSFAYVIVQKRTSATHDIEGGWIYHHPERVELTKFKTYLYKLRK